MAENTLASHMAPLQGANPFIPTNYTWTPPSAVVDAKATSDGVVTDAEFDEAPARQPDLSTALDREGSAQVIVATVESAIDRTPQPATPPQSSGGFGWGAVAVIAALAGTIGYAMAPTSDAKPIKKPQSKKRRGTH